MMTVRTEDVDAVRVVSIDRPDTRNAVDSTTAHLLAESFEDFDSDDRARVAVLTGAGDTFCSGADLREVAAGRALDDLHGPMGPTRMTLGKPVIAAIEGYAVAGGLELALWCDIRIAAENAVLGVFNRRFGVPLVDLGTVRLPRIIGQGRALDLILTGRRVGAEEALAIGLVNRVVPDGQSLTAAIELATKLASVPQVAMRNDRLSVLEQWGMSITSAGEFEWRMGQDTMTRGDVANLARDFVAGEGRHGEP